MGKGRRGGRQGFGFGGHSLAEGAGARGREKRGMLNQMSGIMVLSAGVAGAFFGYSVFGLVGAAIGFIACAGFTSKFVTGGRYFR